MSKREKANERYFNFWGYGLSASFLLTPVFIKFLSRKGYGQQIRDDGPKTHHTKRGTPTMGGVILILAAIAGYLISHLFTSSINNFCSIGNWSNSKPRFNRLS